MSFHQDVRDYMKGFAPTVGPLRLLLVNTWLGDTEKSTAVAEGMQGINGGITKKQWKIFYSGGNLTHVEIPVEEWLT